MWPEPGEIAGSARWHLFDFDPATGRATLLRLDEPHYRQASFLDERVLPAARARAGMPLEEFAQALHPARPAPAPRYIFHIGHCGSTLLSRALDASLNTLPLREPLTLRRIAALDPDRQGAALETAVRAHSRNFRPGQSAVIKATSTCNALIAPLLAERAGSCAVLMYVDLAAYLAGLLGRQSPARDLDGHLPARLAEWNRIDGAPALDPAHFAEPQRAALAWLTGMRHLLAAARDLGDRVRLLDFEDFLAEPEATLTGIAAFFGLESDREELLAAWPEVARGYSKQPERPFSAFNRRRVIERGWRERGTDIRSGLDWAEEQVRRVDALGYCGAYFGRMDPGSRPG